MNGDASNFLEEHGESMIFAERLELWKGIIEGVMYLHVCRPAIVHGDLKPGNVLIDDNGKPRLCDFGLARVFLEEGSTGMTTTSEHTGTTRYLAPELVSGDESVHPTTASDAYAIGCLGLEILFLQKPYAHHVNNMRGQIIRDIKAGTPPASTPPHREWPSRRVWRLLTSLWNPDPKMRPLVFMFALPLEETEFTFPVNVIRKIVGHLHAIRCKADAQRWCEYTCSMYNLALVSRGYWTIVHPILYEIVWFHRYNQDRMELFLHALQSSCSTSLPNLSIGRNGYSQFVKTLVIDAPQTMDPWISGGTIAHLKKTAATRLIILCEPQFGRLKLPAMRHPLVTVEFREVDTSFITTSITHVNFLSSLQRLVVRGHVPVSSFRGPENVILPYLLEIVIDCAEWINDEPTGILFDAFSAWSMPCLQFFYYISEVYPENAARKLMLFLRIHGRGLRHITFGIDNGLPEQALQSCPNLRSVKIGLTTLDALHRVAHAQVERFSCHIRSGPSQRYSALSPLVKNFMESARNRLPKVVDGEFTYSTYDVSRYRPIIVKYSVGNNSVMMVRGQVHSREW